MDSISVSYTLSITMNDDTLLPFEYTASTYEILSAYCILFIVPFLSFIILQACIILHYIR